MLRRLSRTIEWLADSFGGLPFIAVYNVVTLLWVLAGILLPHFPDRYPSNFYTLTVSWLAINMSSLLLYVSKRTSAAEQYNEEHKVYVLETLLRLAETEEDYEPLLKQIAHNQIVILRQLRITENARKAATKQERR